MSVHMKAKRFDEVPNVPSLGQSMKQGKSQKHGGPKEAALAQTMKQGGRYPGGKSPNYIGATMRQSGGSKKK